MTTIRGASMTPLGRLRPAASDAEISEPRLLRVVARIDVAQVDEHLAAHQLSDLGEVERTEFVPFGDDHQRVRISRSRQCIGGEFDLVEDPFRLLARYRIERAHAGTARDEPV